MKIQCNMKGSRFIDVTEDHLKTISKYNLLSDLIDSSGMVDDSTPRTKTTCLGSAAMSSFTTT